MSGFYFLFNRRDRFVADPAGNDKLEIIEIGGDVQGKAVAGDAAGDMYANGGDLFWGKPLGIVLAISI